MTSLVTERLQLVRIHRGPNGIPTRLFTFLAERHFELIILAGAAKRMGFLFGRTTDMSNRRPATAGPSDLVTSVDEKVARR